MLQAKLANTVDILGTQLHLGSAIPDDLKGQILPILMIASGKAETNLALFLQYVSLT